MTEDPRLNDAPVDAAGDGRKPRGHSILWTLAAIAVALGALAFAASLHPTATTDKGATPVGGPAASAAASPTSSADSSGAKP